jgi:hypothetical protein
MRPGLSVLVLVLLAAAAAAGPKKDAKSPLPGKASWDLRAFNVAFRVTDTGYDADKNRVTWALETKEAVRTSDLQKELNDKPFVFTFYDADMSELATVRIDAAGVKGIPRERVTPAGTRLEVTLDVPAVLDKAKQVVLRRGGGA